MSYQLELRHFKYFLAVAEELHFRKAADKLYISQPGLSRQIKQMEEDLGIKLFERNNKNVELTEAGIYLKEELSRALKNIDEVLDHAKLLNKGVEGKISLGYVGSAMQNVIPDLMLKFREKHESIIFNLQEMENLKQIDALLNNRIDVGFVRMERVPKDLKIKPVFEDSFSLVLPAKHKITKRNFKNLKQLMDEPFILFDKSYSPAYYEKVIQIFEFSGFAPNVSHSTFFGSTIFKLVENNFGVSIVPTSMQLGYNLDIKFIELKNIPQKTILSAAWNKNNRNPVLKKLLRFI